MVAYRRPIVAVPPLPPIDWQAESEKATEGLRAVRLEQLIHQRWQAYAVTLLVFEGTHLMRVSVRLFHGVPTSEGLRRAFAGEAFNQGGFQGEEDRFVVVERDEGVMAGFLRGGQAASDVVVRVKRHAILGDDGV